MNLKINLELELCIEKFTLRQKKIRFKVSDFELKI